MAILVGGCLGTMPWNSSDMGVVPETAKVCTCITSSIYAQMRQVRSPLVSTCNIDDD